MRLILICLGLLVFIGCSRNNDLSAPQGPALTTMQNISEIKFTSIKEVELQGLAEKTFVRVGLFNDTAVISVMTVLGDAVSYKTTTIQNMKADDKLEILHEETQQSGLFNVQFNNQVQSTRLIQTHFSEFKILMQAYHLRDIYRCRSSKLWSKLVDYTPDKRGPGMLRLGEEFYFSEFESEALLAIDYESKKLVGISFRRNHFVQESAHLDYYSPVYQSDDDLVFGPVSRLTESFGMFLSFCNEEYSELLPNYSGGLYFRDLDKEASLMVDAQIDHVFRNTKDNEFNYLDISRGPRYLDEIIENLEKTKNFALKPQWDFYFQAIQNVRSKNNITN